jgi:hypothetical protein
MQNPIRRKDGCSLSTAQVVEQREKTAHSAGQLCQHAGADLFVCLESASGFNIDSMPSGYTEWIARVQETLRSINMSMEDWQSRWPFDFQVEYRAGTRADDAAMRANRFWWFEQNKSLGQNCRLSFNCWLPSGHQDTCEPVSESPYRAGITSRLNFRTRRPESASGCGYESHIAITTSSWFSASWITRP